MLDDVYGNNSVNHCAESHPHIYWNSKEFSKSKNLTLRPDTIMIHPNRKDKIYNAFLLPYGMKENEGSLVPLGSTTEDWYSQKEMSENEFLKIKAIRVNTVNVLDSIIPISLF